MNQGQSVPWEPLSAWPGSKSDWETMRHAVEVLEQSDQRYPDEYRRDRPAAHFRAVFPEQDQQSASRITPAVILRVLSLAIELASEGREAHPIGAMFVVGDTRQVLKHTQQLVVSVPWHRRELDA